MGLSLQTNVAKPPRILIYGPPKIGKSSFGAMAEKPVFIQTEDGLDAIINDSPDVQAFPLAKDFKTVIGYLGELIENDHDRKTVVIDSVDWLEKLIWDKVAEENNKKSIEDIGYGKGYLMALDLWQQYIECLNYLRDYKGMMVIQIAHAQVKRFENPDTEAYDRYEVKLHKLAGAKLTEHSEIILFANYYVGVKKESDRSGQKDEDKRRRAIGSGERILHTQERPAFIAGSRYNLPAEIPFDKDGKYWSVIAASVPYFNKPTAA